MAAAPKEWLSAAECAARTGLTVRALRVYEREGLLDTQRSANGWRRYGPADLARLNAIVALKTLGLTLAQIRGVLADSPPSLLRILDVQTRAWRAKLETAQRALALTEAARSRLQVDHELSLDELCELIKSLDSERSSTMENAATVIRELINERMSPQDERTWVTWWAQHPEDATQMKALRDAAAPLMKELQALADSGADPKSREAQAIESRHQALLLQFGHAERMARLLDWNTPLTEKWTSLGPEVRRRDVLASQGFGRTALDFLNKARTASPAVREAVSLLDAAKTLLASGTDPASSAADEVVQQLERLCVEYGLGDAYAYARWTPLAARINQIEPLEQHEDAWDFLARAVRARANERDSDP